MTAPAMLIVKESTIGTTPVDVLECGHVVGSRCVIPAGQVLGARKCRKCGEGLPPDVMTVAELSEATKRLMHFSWFWQKECRR